MPIYTPRGLKIRIPPTQAFAWMGLLRPKVAVFDVLKAVEAIESLPAVFALVAGVYCAVYRLSPQEVLVTVGTAGVVGGVVGAFIPFALPGAIPLARLYSYVSGFGMALAAIGAALWLRSGVLAVAAFFAARIAGGAVNGLLNLWRASNAQRETGDPLQASELAFSAALRHLCDVDWRGHVVRLRRSAGCGSRQGHLRRVCRCIA